MFQRLAFLKLSALKQFAQSIQGNRQFQFAQSKSIFEILSHGKNQDPRVLARIAQ